MDYQAITIDGYNGEQTSAVRRKWKPLPNGAASSSLIKDEDEELHEWESNASLSSLSGDEFRVSVPAKTQRHKEERRQDEAAFQYSLTLIERRLDEKRGAIRRGGSRSSSVCIFWFPESLAGINPNAYQPELVSIGPYHRGKDCVLEFEEHKWLFLDKFLSRSTKSLSHYLTNLIDLEQDARDCYSELVVMSSHDFVEMMLLDGSFVLELLYHLNHSGDVIEDDDPILTRPWLIPILIRDLLKLENQLPYFVLHLLFKLAGVNKNKNIDPEPHPEPKALKDPDPLPILALRVFDLVFPRPSEILNQFSDWKGRHLLELFHLSLLPSQQVTNCINSDQYQPSEHSIQCVTQLRPSGIKFKSRKSNSFLDINFQNQVLEIPSITINDFTSIILINCVALEQCQDLRFKYVTDYCSFMSCLINQPRDVAFLCSDGIITRFSLDDQFVADFFKNLGKNAVFNIRECSLSKQFREVESYYSSNWATMRRTYFSSPWSFISLVSAIVLLLLTMVQSIMSVVSYKCF